MKNSKVLLVDNHEENLIALENLLKESVGEVVKARSGTEAIEQLLKSDFAVAVIEVQMPGMDGFELAELMRDSERIRSVPIIFVTSGVLSRASTFRGYESGAVDFLHKPLDPHIVKSKIQVFIDLAKQGRLLRDRLAETQAALKERDIALAAAREALQSRDEFLSIASHELKTPLTSLFLQLQMMERGLKKHAEKREENNGQLSAEQFDRFTHSTETALRQSAKLSSLLDELLDLTRIRLGRLSLQMRQVDVHQLVTEAFERIRAVALKAKVDLVLECPKGHKGFWDPVRIDQVISNLLTNGIKYGEGSAVTLSVVPNNEGSVSFFVEDKGPGIPADLQEKIFERFERAVSGNQISGLGLGLYISRQIVEAHQGKISVCSEEGKGACFEVRLPLGKKENV
ncbi:MAG: hybrid sensor histidine kinase/response regulator [Bdellovibrionota bacterium]